MSIDFRYGAVAIGLALLMALLVKWQTSISAPVAWVISVNVVAFFTYGYDKSIAGSNEMRVPERVLLLLALPGGTPASWVAMQVFRHKTAKQDFLRRFWFVVLFQVITLIVLLVVTRQG